MHAVEIRCEDEDSHINQRLILNVYCENDQLCVLWLLLITFVYNKQ